MNDFNKHIESLHKSIGIPDNYQNKFGLPLQTEETDLVEIECDIHGRPQQASRIAAKPWLNMQKQAQKDGVILNLVSAYRSVVKQKQILENKLNKGFDMSDILKFCAAPGFSEHHTGRAFDITTPDCEHLTESFENTDAFLWLTRYANTFSFWMSYPKNNSYGIDYEPWHWIYRV